MTMQSTAVDLHDTPAPLTAEPGDERLMHHAYDGIREYDNPLPGWWSAIFIGSIVFAAVYGVYYHVARWGKSPGETYQVALADYEAQRGAREAAEARSVNEDVLKKNTADPAILATGRKVFEVRCVSCHTADGRGLIGPNLTDEFQLHGATRMDIYTTVKKGVPGTAMLAWGEQLSGPDVIAVASYVTTLRGLNLPGKAREGQPVQPFAP